MALSVFAGSFTKNTGTGAQAVTGVGFTPKILIFWTAYKTASGAASDDYSFAWGMTTGAAESYSCSVSSQGNVATSNRSRRAAAKAITVVQYGETLLAEADLTTFGADGFTLDWTTNTGGSQIIHFLALGGTDITGQKVFTWTSKTSTGSHAVTGVGFQPTGLIFARQISSTALPTSASTMDLAISFIDSSGNATALNIGGDDGVANPDHLTYRTMSVTQATYLTSTAQTTREASTLTSMDADGFTLNYTTVTGTADIVGALAIKGLRLKVGNFFATTTVTGVGWRPTALLFMGVQDQFLSNRLDMRLAVGGTTGSTAALNQSTSAIDDRSSSTGGNTNATGAQDTSQAILIMSSSPLGISGDIRLVSFDSDGFTLDAANGIYYGFMAFSDVPVGVGSYIDEGEEG